MGPEGFEQLRAGERKLTDPDVVAAAQLLLDLQPFYNAGFQATDYTTAKAIFANGQGAMMVAGTADFTGYRQVNPEADLGFIAWPGPEAGKYATTTGFELLYTVSALRLAREAGGGDQVRQLAGDGRSAADRLGHRSRCRSTRTSPNRPIRSARRRWPRRGRDVPVWYDVPETNGSDDRGRRTTTAVSGPAA